MAAALSSDGMGGPSPAAGLRSPGGVPSSNSGGSAAKARRGDVDEDGVRVQDEYVTSRMVDDGLPDMMRAMLQQGSMNGGARGMQAHMPPFGGPFGGPAAGLAGTEQLLAAMADRGMGGKLSMPSAPPVVDVPDAQYMFPLPPAAKRLNCGGNVSQARQRAREEHKWVLVNLQSVDVFESHRLNRDTWGDETIVSLLESAFVFWQRSSSSEQGRNYMRLYGVPDEHLPQIAIIGPTGAKVYATTGEDASGRCCRAGVLACCRVGVLAFFLKAERVIRNPSCFSVRVCSFLGACPCRLHAASRPFLHAR